ncbi:hypothetical protein TcWFU_006722 [Taenia crassiceps]|uniref:Uncharacterized protein n=1 Tax=Taenia crassiceps TaxID=6207 RepID=A0ABR4QI91_9CEST
MYDSKRRKRCGGKETFQRLHRLRFSRWDRVDGHLLALVSTAPSTSISRIIVVMRIDQQGCVGNQLVQPSRALRVGQHNGTLNTGKCSDRMSNERIRDGSASEIGFN